jgi:predicted nucleic acid-binding protein
VLRIVLDVNVWVANYLASARGREGTSCQSLVEMAIVGYCRLGPLVSHISLPMLDTLQAVLQRELDISAELAEAARNVAQDAGSPPLPPLLVLGGGLQPMKDEEDAGVLETALAAGADLLVTANMKDFTPGPKGDIDAEVIRTRQSVADVLLFRNAKAAEGLVITTPFVAKAWLVDGYLPPPGILGRFMPRVDAAPPGEEVPQPPGARG